MIFIFLLKFIMLSANFVHNQVSSRCHVTLTIFQTMYVGDKIDQNDLYFHDLNDNWMDLFPENASDVKNDFEWFDVETAEDEGQYILS